MTMPTLMMPMVSNRHHRHHQRRHDQHHQHHGMISIISIIIATVAITYVGPELLRRLKYPSHVLPSI